MSRTPHTNYGTIPTTTTPTSSNPKTEFISKFKQKSQSILSTQRPWTELTDPSAFSTPYTYTEAMTRIRKNLSHFSLNYTLIMLIILFLSLLWHPVSMIVFLIIFVGWLFLYFFRDEPIVVWNWVIGEKFVLAGLGLVTVVALAVTDVGMNVLVSLIVGVVIVAVHAAFRVTHDLFLDEEEAVDGGLVSVVGSTMPSSYTRV